NVQNELLVPCSHNRNMNLLSTYKLMFTLSVPQKGCERSFPKLKYIINYLRNTLNQDILESFI
ncbi:zinc finger MYM-type protein 1-like, partial [Aphis craccivora]